MGRDRPAHVLVVDDNVGFLRVLVAVLEEADPGFKVHTVETGEEALAFLLRQGRFAGAPRPAFIVLDFRLPDLDAPEMLAHLAGTPFARDLPVLVRSQADWPEDEASCLATGACRFRVKPSELEELRAVVVEFWRDVVSPQ